jgi:hypothetical protein
MVGVRPGQAQRLKLTPNLQALQVTAVPNKLGETLHCKAISLRYVKRLAVDIA